MIDGRELAFREDGYGQTYFIKLFGANVNLGNIAPPEVLALETLRIGLRSDTFFTFIDAKSKAEFSN